MEENTPFNWTDYPTLSCFRDMPEDVMRILHHVYWKLMNSNHNTDMTLPPYELPGMLVKAESVLSSVIGLGEKCAAVLCPVIHSLLYIFWVVSVSAMDMRVRQFWPLPASQRSGHDEDLLMDQGDVLVLDSLMFWMLQYTIILA